MSASNFLSAFPRNEIPRIHFCRKEILKFAPHLVNFATAVLFLGEIMVKAKTENETRPYFRELAHSASRYPYKGSIINATLCLALLSLDNTPSAISYVEFLIIS